MKKILLTVALATAVTSATFGQGVVVFNTRGGGVDAPVTNIITGARIGAGYLAQLYYGAVGQSVETFYEVTNAPASFSPTTLGYILTSSGGGNRNLDLTKPGVTGGAPTQFQVRAWEAALGQSWGAANTAYLNPSDALYGKAVIGVSAVIIAPSSSSPADTPKPLAGLAGFSLVPVPEPSVIALGLLGLAALVWRRRQ